MNVYRSDGEHLTPDDASGVKAAIGKLRETEPDRIPPYRQFDFEYGGSRRVDGVEHAHPTLGRGESMPPFARSAHQKTVLQPQIEATDRQIGRLGRRK